MLLRLLWSAIGTSRQFAGSHQIGRYRSKADMRRCHALTGSDALDPSVTCAAWNCCCANWASCPISAGAISCI